MNYPHRLVPEHFKVPSELATDEFKLRTLTVNDVAKDYEAVMTSIEHLQGVFGKQSKWPSPDLSFEQDLIDLGWHQKEFQRRTSFAYTVVSLDGSKCLGCVYIYPPSTDGFDAEVFLWARQSEAANGLEARLFHTVKQWIETTWPFKKVAYPGRELVTGNRIDSNKST